MRVPARFEGFARVCSLGLGGEEWSFDLCPQSFRRLEAEAAHIFQTLRPIVNANPYKGEPRNVHLLE